MTDSPDPLDTAELGQDEDPGHYIHAVEQAVDDLRRFAFSSPRGREGLAREGRRLLEAQRKFVTLAFYLSLYVKDAA